MTLFERIKFLAEKQGKSINDVEGELGYAKNTLYRLKKTNPSAKKLEEIADHFGVSTDYLLGRTDSPDINDDSIAYYRIDTTGLSDKEVSELRNELNEYTDFLKEKLRKRNNGGD
ncbi:XRE family transcriptional regulator [Lactobacillus brevis] [Lactiplantibacillus mudanjiangensis]|uniref:helix-turn-helix domain-containing protein n=1 Tax=Lactiplantibacillus mudanjiangensis TaxID=1296538 RepID=UPI0010140AF1|nr:XRE family transcriptional regulator [Lactobacillus brevis] [Lactiplantibacillus mudanjiangensis]